MIVVDASAALELLLRSPASEAIEARVFAADQTLHAPHLIDLEIAQVLRRYVHIGDITAVRGEAALADWSDMAVQRYPHDLLLPRIWALRATLTAYDAAYVALAEALDAPLLTCDARIARAPGHRARVEVAA